MEVHLSSVAQGASLQIAICTFRYNGDPVLGQVDLRFAGPGLAALVGPNGSGKSTLLKIASGLIRSSGAAVQVCGKDVGAISLRELAGLIAWVPQRADLLFSMTVREMVRIGRYRVERPLRPPPAGEEEIVDSAIRSVGLESFVDREVDTLSGGEWQRAMIARAIAQETPILILDEPIASLDLRYQDEIYRLLRRLASSGRLVVVADHHLEVVAAHADRLILLSGGSIAADGPPAEILTADQIEKAFRVRTKVFADPYTGTPRLSRTEAER